MANFTDAQVAALKKFINEGNIYINVEAPDKAASGVNKYLHLLSGANAGMPPKAADNTNPAVSVGLTTGPAEFNYKPSYEGMEIEQATGKVAWRMKDEGATLKFTCAQATYDNIRTGLGAGLAETITESGKPTIELTTVGGLTFIDEVCIALVSEIGVWDNAGTPVTLYEVLVLYKTIATEGVTLSWKRNETRLVEVTLTAIPDPTRKAGDQLFQHYQMRIPG